MTRTRPLALAAALLAGALALTGCAPSTVTADPATSAPGATVSITDAQQRTVAVPANPAVVVVTDWSIIRTLNDLGIEVDAIPAPIGQLPADLAAYASGKTTVGDVFEPDYEAIAALEPDLVLVGGRSGTKEVVAEFERFAPAVLDMSVRPETASETLKVTRQRIEELASIFGSTEKAKSLMDAVEADIAAQRTAVQAAGHTAMIVQVSDGTVSAYGPGSRFGSVFTDFGYATTSAPVSAEGEHGEEISQEFFVQYNPGVLFVLDRAKAIGQEASPALDILNAGMITTTDAAKSARVVEIDGFSWYLAPNAPSSWARMVDDVESIN